MQLFNIEDSQTGRQANNVLASAVADSVRPWFADVADSARVVRALAKLGSDHAAERAAASRYLGLRVVKVA